MPCSFGPFHSPRSEAGTQLSRRVGVTVVVRWLPLVTAACGTRVARPASTTMLPPRRLLLAGPQREARPR
jgi:hypothetical protein